MPYRMPSGWSRLVSEYLDMTGGMSGYPYRTRRIANGTPCCCNMLKSMDVEFASVKARHARSRKRSGTTGKRLVLFETGVRLGVRNGGIRNGLLAGKRRYGVGVAEAYDGPPHFGTVSAVPEPVRLSIPLASPCGRREGWVPQTVERLLRHHNTGRGKGPKASS